MEIEELLEQIEIAEAELEEQKEAKLKYEQDEAEGGDWADELAEIRVDIMATERNLRDLRDRAMRCAKEIDIIDQLREAKAELASWERVTERLRNA